jgi:hypothetical protein
MLLSIVTLGSSLLHGKNQYQKQGISNKTYQISGSDSLGLEGSRAPKPYSIEHIGLIGQALKTCCVRSDSPFHTHAARLNIAAVDIEFIVVYIQ